MTERIVVEFIQKAILAESSDQLYMKAVSEAVERLGMKNTARLLLALAYARESISKRLIRDSGDLPEIITHDILRSADNRRTLYEEIKNQAEKHLEPHVVQTAFFALQSAEKEVTILKEILSNIGEDRDHQSTEFYVCPLCGYVMSETYVRCPVCGANNAIFRKF